MGIYFSQTSVLYFCWGFSCCPYYRGVRNSEVSARQELTVNANKDPFSNQGEGHDDDDD